MKQKTILFIVIGLLLLLNLSFIGSSFFKEGTAGSISKTYSNEAEKSYEIGADKILDAKNFVAKNKFNEEVCFIINMKLHSGKNRFFVYDLKKDSVQMAGLVAHGNCYQYWLEGRKYNNEIGDGCTSLGKYKVGNPYNGKFGRAYKLHGLDKTNNNAFARFVVLHSYECVPETETDEDICQSNGCPMVSPGFLKNLQQIIDKSGKPILLYIYG